MAGVVPQVEGILELLTEAGVDTATLFIVPGSGWDEAGLARVREWHAQGWTLAGHGWEHRAVPPRTLYHRLHSLILSRDCAEHLSLETDAVAALIGRCFAWFDAHGLAAPRLYVPPAWALGRISRARLRELPFHLYESLSGVYDAESDRFRRLPLVGFEADTALRVPVLRAANAANVAMHRVLRKPLRISIHPFDLDLRLAGDVVRLLSCCDCFLEYDALVAGG